MSVFAVSCGSMKYVSVCFVVSIHGRTLAGGGGTVSIWQRLVPGCVMSWWFDAVTNWFTQFIVGEDFWCPSLSSASRESARPRCNFHLDRVDAVLQSNPIWKDSFYLIWCAPLIQQFK